MPVMHSVPKQIHNGTSISSIPSGSVKYVTRVRDSFGVIRRIVE